MKECHATQTITEAVRPILGDDNVKSIPKELRDREQWVCWEYEMRAGKRTKVPYSGETGRIASTIDPTTWTSFETVMAVAERYDGIGFVFSQDDPYVGIDLDDCLADAGQAVPEAAAIIEQIASYGEYSPNGGVKIIAKGSLPDGIHGKRTKKVEGFKEVEIYDAGRYFTITGRHYPSSPTTIEARPEQVQDLYCSLWKKPNKQPDGGAATLSRAMSSPDVDEILNKAFASKSGQKIRALYDGDLSAHGGDHSAADLALCNYLSGFCDGDPKLIDQVFRQSKLMRSKWDERHAGDGSTYGQMTITKALDGQPMSRDGNNEINQANIIAYPEPLRLAEHFINQRFVNQEHVLLIRRYQSRFYVFEGSSYRVLSDEELDSKIYKHLDQLFTPKRDKYGEIVKDKVTDRDVLKKVSPNFHLVREVRLAMPSLNILLDDRLAVPSWMDSLPHPDPREIVVCRNGLLDLPNRALIPSTPMLFCTHGLEFNYDPTAPKPVHWIQFLQSLWNDDKQASLTLGEMFGYILTPNTRQQKIFLIVGPRRSGKGTIGRVLASLIGQTNVCAPTLGSLSMNFGLAPLIGKLLAIISDARLSGRVDGAAITEALLSISGEDRLSIDRKYLPAWQGQLPTRFVIMTNELPRLGDTSGALAGRLIILKLSKSWYGTEDHGLFNKLGPELPSILNWAVEGAHRLQQRGHFIQPESSEESIEQFAELSSPVASFIDDCCELGEGHRVAVDALYCRWRRWCENQGYSHITNDATFGRDLVAAASQVRKRRNRAKNETFYDGIRLNATY